MDGYEQQELNDIALEQEIEAAIRVDPSPEFLSKVRTRIAGERVSRSWGLHATWQWAAAAATVTLVAIASVWTLRDPVTIRRDARLGTPAREAAHQEPEVLEASPDTPRAVSAPVVRAAGAARRSVEDRPEVVVSPDEAVALRQLVMAIGARQVEAADIPKLGVESTPLPPIEELVLEPMVVSPMAGLEGE